MRVRFPDGYVLEADFLPSERIHSLVDLLMKVLARPDLPFYLCKFCFSILSYFTLDHFFIFYNLIWVWFAMIRLYYICFWQANMLSIMASRETANWHKYFPTYKIFENFNTSFCAKGLLSILRQLLLRAIRQ